VWDLRTLKLLDTLSIVHTGVIYDVMVHNDVIYTASQDSTIRTWSNKTYNPKELLRRGGRRPAHTTG
jgi:WD40 repeat protein